jgi:hypothetical protein
MIPARYRVLVANMLGPVDQAQALAEARTIITGDEAKAFQGKIPWGCEIPDTKGRIRILRYKGVEVVLYLRREITEVEPFPGDPVPAGLIKDPDDAWVRFELLGPSAKHVAALSTKQRVQLSRDLATTRLELTIKERQFDALETEHLKTMQTLEKAQDEIKKLKGKVKQ